MDYEHFKEIIQNNILKYLPEEHSNGEVRIVPCTKNNGLELDGMTIVGKQQVNPSLYLNFYYEDYLKGKHLDEIMEVIARDYTTAQKNKPLDTLEFDYEKVKDHIFVAVCNAEMNRDLLKDVPHELHEDLALTYKVHYNFENLGEANIQIKNSHLEMWGIDEQTLKAGVWESMKKEMPVNFTCMDEVLQELMNDSIFKLPELPEGKEPLYVLTNEEKWLGAAYMFDQETMEGIAGQLQGNLIIIPSSVHECLIVKETQEMDLQELKEIVSEINNFMVSREEVLSDEIYRYDAESHSLSMVDDFGCQQMGMDM